MCFNCFSCHASGGLEWLVMQSLPDTFKNFYEVDKFIRDRYNVDLSSYDVTLAKNLRRYGDTIPSPDPRGEKKIIPKSFIAPFKSGKETYKYFYNRGFTKETLQHFKIGRDLENKTVIIPLFYDNENELAGCIGRYIDPNRRKNERYKIYEVNTGSLVFPQDKCKPLDDVLIVVEGTLDAIYMHQLGYTNTFATLTNAISTTQTQWVKKQNATKLLDLTDNDDMGNIATSIIKQKLGKTLQIINAKQFYPDGCKDPNDCTKEQIDTLIHKALHSNKKALKRM